MPIKSATHTHVHTFQGDSQNEYAFVRLLCVFAAEVIAIECNILAWNGIVHTGFRQHVLLTPCFISYHHITFILCARIPCFSHKANKIVRTGHSERTSERCIPFRLN